MHNHGNGPKVFFVKAYDCWRNGKRYRVGDYHRGMSPPLTCQYSSQQLTFAFKPSDTV